MKTRSPHRQPLDLTLVTDQDVRHRSTFRRMLEALSANEKVS